MPLRKRGEMGGCEGFIDLDQMRNTLPGDPSDSDPGHEVKAAHNIRFVIHRCGQMCYYPAMTHIACGMWIMRKPVDSVAAFGECVSL